MSFDSTVLADSPVAYLKLADTSGTIAADTSGNGHTGTYHNVILNQTGLISGEADKATAFNGTTSYVDLGNPAALQIVGQIAIEAIVNTAFPSSGGGIQLMIASKGYDGTNEDTFRFFVNPSNSTKQLQGGCFEGGGFTDNHAVANITWASNETHIVAAQYTGTQWEVYIDGILAATFASTFGQLATAKNFILGGEDTGSIVNFFNGIMEKVSIYNTSLSLARWQAHAVAAGFTLPPPTISMVSVPATGEKITFLTSSSVTGLILSDFSATADGVVLPLKSLTGSGSSYALVLGPIFIAVSQVIHVTYSGSVAVPGTFNATNNSTISMAIVNYNKKQFGAFLHFSTATWAYDYLPSGPTQVAINNFFNPISYNMDQWLDSVQTMGAKYAVLTTKHDAGFCLWPTSSGTVNVGATPWYVSTGIDIVRDFTTKCRARGLGVGLYINFYDPWFTLSRSGANGTYVNTAPTFTEYISQQITELLSNYGAIDILWTDSWAYTAAIGYTNADYATIRALITSLQPNCLLVNNTHTGALDHTDIVEYEGPGMSIPSASNIIASEFCETAMADGNWVWDIAGNGAAIVPTSAVTHLNSCVAAKCNYLLNLPPNTSGLMANLTVVFAQAVGAILGIPPVPPPAPPLSPAGVNYDIWSIVAGFGYGGQSPTANLSVGQSLQDAADYLKSISYLPNTEQLSAVAAIEAVLLASYNTGGPGAGASVQIIAYNLWLVANSFYSGPAPVNGESMGSLLRSSASILEAISYLPPAKQADAINAIVAYLMEIYG